MQSRDANIDSVRSRIVAFLPRLRRFCRLLTRSEDRGDDLMQSTVEKALTRIDQWQSGTSLESWMFRIAQNLHIDAMRAQSRRGQEVDVDALEMVAGDDGRRIVEGRSDIDRVGQAMLALPYEQRSILALVALEECSYREVSEILDIPIGTVMSRLSRARAALDRSLHGEVEGAGNDQ